MDCWPSDYRTNVTPHGQGRRRRAEQKDPTPNYPDVKLGSLTAVTLFEKDHRLEWTSASKNTLPKSMNHRRITTIFPPTRPPRLRTPKTTILQRAEQGANFLRTYLPDIDIPAELIRDEIYQDAKIWKKFGTFDPYVGSLLEYVPCDSNTAFLAFPMGELKRDLNLSSIHYLARHEVSFNPNTSVVRSFKTPIQQIVSSKYITDHTERDSYLAVRTFDTTSVMRVTTTDAFKHSAQVAELASFVHTDMGHRAIVDIKLIPLPCEALAITESGALYRLNLADRQKAVSIIRPATSDDVESVNDSFWRIAPGGSGVDCFLASSKSVILQDFRSRSSIDMFKIPRQQDVLTSIDHGGDNILRLCSTRDIIWMDKRYPNKPLLGHEHGRQYDRSLEAHTVLFQTQLTLLTSRNNMLVTVYDISRSTGQFVQMNNLPYCLFPDETVDTCIGSVFFRHPHSSNENLSLVRLSDEGSLYHFDLAIAGLEDSVFNTSWSTDVKELDAQRRHLLPDAGSLGAQDFSETDFRLPYNAIFHVYAEEHANVEEDNAKAVYDLLDQIPDFWQNSDVPVEHMLTMFDVAFRSGPQPIQASRADFLTQGIINSKRGYRALLQDRLPAQGLMKGASWHYNINTIIKHLDPDVTSDIRSCTEALRRYDLVTEPERGARSFEWENEAREQLALDLALSGDVFSDQPFSAFTDGSSELEAMTKTLSLGSGPPDVKFGFLRPVLKSSAGHYHTTTEEDGVVSFTGVRALLKDWVVGTNPQIPSVRDYSNGTILSDSSTLFPSDEAAGHTQGLQTSSSRRPPLVVASTNVLSSQAEGFKRGFRVDHFQVSGIPQRGFVMESQPMFAATEPLDSSQDYITSTQILPGPYGGRGLSGQKKMGKKRLGGF